MALSLQSTLRRVFTTPYQPAPEDREFLSRAQSQTQGPVDVQVAVLDARESFRVFGVHLARHGIQPVFLRIENLSPAPLRLQLIHLDPNYYTPLEAAASSHFSILRRLSAFGLLVWLFLPLLLLVPFKLLTAWRANRRMDELFKSLAFHLRPIPPGTTAAGFVFTSLDAGTKIVHVALHATGGPAPTAAQVTRLTREQPSDPPADDSDSAAVELSAATTAGSTADGATDVDHTAAKIEFTFSIAVPGIAVDYLHRDFQTLLPADSLVECDVASVVARLRAMPATTSNAAGSRAGDPVNLVVIGNFDVLLGAFAARWDESETITLASCWKTARSFVMGMEYRYSPVSALYLFGRSQDLALQRSRRSIDERLHLRLWLTPLLFQRQPVWVGQVSRDIGVRFTIKTWNLSTHRVDPDVDEARDYVIEDLLQAERVQAAGYVDGGTPRSSAVPGHNLTGDPYFTDGKRAVILLSGTRAQPRFVAW